MTPQVFNFKRVMKSMFILHTCLTSNSFIAHCFHLHEERRERSIKVPFKVFKLQLKNALLNGWYLFYSLLPSLPLPLSQSHNLMM